MAAQPGLHPNLVALARHERHLHERAPRRTAPPPRPRPPPPCRGRRWRGPVAAAGATRPTRAGPRQSRAPGRRRALEHGEVDAHGRAPFELVLQGVARRGGARERAPGRWCRGRCGARRERGARLVAERGARAGRAASPPRARGPAAARRGRRRACPRRRRRGSSAAMRRRWRASCAARSDGPAGARPIDPHADAVARLQPPPGVGRPAASPSTNTLPRSSQDAARLRDAAPPWRASQRSRRMPARPRRSPTPASRSPVGTVTADEQHTIAGRGVGGASSYGQRRGHGAGGDERHRPGRLSRRVPLDDRSHGGRRRGRMARPRSPRRRTRPGARRRAPGRHRRLRDLRTWWRRPSCCCARACCHPGPRGRSPRPC